MFVLLQSIHITKHFIKTCLVFITSYFFLFKLQAQELKTSDTTQKIKVDTSVIIKKTIPKHDPKIATRRSLILPGWGQAYNKEYWKIPIVYGALSIPTITFFYNNTVYKETKFAYDARVKAAQLGATSADSTDYFSLESKYKTAGINAIQSVRNASRRDRDYSILWFLVVWGLNVADATVFGHLKNFDVGKDLSMNIKPDYNFATRSPGFSLTLSVKSPTKKTLVVR
jgi:hypothetical protein